MENCQHYHNMFRGIKNWHWLRYCETGLMWAPVNYPYGIYNVPIPISKRLRDYMNRKG